MGPIASFLTVFLFAMQLNADTTQYNKINIIDTMLTNLSNKLLIMFNVE